MSPQVAQLELFKQLNDLDGFTASGLVAVTGDRHEVVIERRGHVRGVWHCTNGKFAWTPAGYGEPNFVADDIAAALAHTKKILIPK